MSRHIVFTMKHEGKKIHHHILHLILPAVGYGVVAGIFTGAVITAYKWCAHEIVALSQSGYEILRGDLSLLPWVALGIVALALIFSAVYKRTPDLKGGGIPTAIAVLRDLITFKWLRNLIGTFVLSLITFLLGVPLGSEGPSVQMGTAVGGGAARLFGKGRTAWSRYAMTGGACAGFAVATGAPVSGVMFALEEAHQRISPMIIIVSAVSVVFSCMVAEILSPILGVSVALFPALDLVALGIGELWIPLLVGAIVGLFAVLFLRYYVLIKGLVKKLAKVPQFVKILSVFVLTVALGLVSFSYVSTGHGLMLSMFSGKEYLWVLLLILVARCTLTLAANANGVTGGMFLPILAIGTVVASIIGQILVELLGLNAAYYELILVMGIVASIASMIKAPITAIVFAVEALSCASNVLPVLVASGVAFVITEVFRAESITERVLADKVKALNKEKKPVVCETHITVQEDSFAIGKQVRDILWPVNLFVLSVRRKEAESSEVDEHGALAMKAGDVLHVRYATFNEAETLAGIEAIVGRAGVPADN